MRVLLIEDEPTTAKAIELMLTTEGFNVYTTDLGEEGLDLGKLYDYDIIVLDLNLPDMHGYDVLKKLRVAKVQTPVLILSGINEMDSKAVSYTHLLARLGIVDDGASVAIAQRDAFGHSLGAGGGQFGQSRHGAAISLSLIHISSVAILETALPPASVMIGVISPPGIATAIEMSARLYLNSVSPAKLTLASGTCSSATPSALISRSLTDSLIPRLSSPALRSARSLSSASRLQSLSLIHI